MYIPQGFSTVTPYIFVQDAENFVRFMYQAFDASERCRSLRPDGRIANTQLQIGNTTLMASEASEAYPAMPSAYYLYVEDADASMASALAAGASLEMEVADMSYGDRQGGVRDPFGNIWWISQRLIDAPYES